MKISKFKATVKYQLSEIITEDKLQEYLKIGWEALSDGYKKSGKEVLVKFSY